MEPIDRELALAIGQAIFVARMYYADPDRKVAGMHTPTPELVEKRKAEIERADRWWLGLVQTFPRT